MLPKGDMYGPCSLAFPDLLYWRPANILLAVLSIPALLTGILVLIGVLTSGAEPAEVLMTVGILLFAAALCIVLP